MLNLLNLYPINFIYILVIIIMYVKQNVAAYMIDAHKYQCFCFKLKIRFNCDFLQLYSFQIQLTKITNEDIKRRDKNYNMNWKFQ